MKDTELTRSSVKRALARLVGLDFLTQEKGYKNSWIYTIGKGSMRGLSETENTGSMDDESKGSRKHDLESPSVDPKSFDVNPSRESDHRNDKKILEEKAQPTSKKRTKGLSLTQWLESLAGAPAIAKGDPVWVFAEKIELPSEMLVLAWHEFKRKHRASEIRHQDWRVMFERFVRSCSARFWYESHGSFYLTVAGQQARKEYERDTGKRLDIAARGDVQ